MGNFILDQTMLPSGYLNQESNDYPGKSVSPDGFWGFDGLLGKWLLLDTNGAASLADSVNVATLYPGVYMMVLTKSGSSASPARGIGAFFDTSANNGFRTSVVTPDISATLISNFAGVYLNAPSKGDYCWIQCAGLASLQCKASSVTSNVAGDVCIFTGLTTNTFDGIADATDHFTTAGAVKKYVGTWYEAPVADAIKLAFLKGTGVARYL